MFLRRVALLLPLLFSGCAAAPQKSAPATSVSFPQDDLKREIALRAPAKRVIVIGPGAIETVYALGAEKSLVGRDDYADYPPAAKKIAIAGDYQGPNVEQCVALKPDLVIVQGETWDKARVEQWQTQIGAPVAALVATDVAGVHTGMDKIERWLGVSLKMRKVPPRVWVSSLTSHSAFIEIGRSPLTTAGQKTLVSDVVEISGWKNVAKVTGYQPYGIESLLANQPEVYIVPSKASREKVLQQLRGNTALSKLKCVREGQVIVIDPDLILRPGPRLTRGIDQLKVAATRFKKK